MVHPLLQMRLSGVVFYQGESNSLAGCPTAYACLWPALIADWRTKFGLPRLSFFFVQLAAYGWHDYTHLRQAQMAALQLPFTVRACDSTAHPYKALEPRPHETGGSAVHG